MHGFLCIFHLCPAVWLLRTNRVAAAGKTALAGRISIVVVQASLTVRTICIVSTAATVTSVSSGTIQLGVEVTFCALSITVTCWNRDTTSSQNFNVKTPRGGINVPITQTITFAHKINAWKIWGGTRLNYADVVWQSSGFRVGLLPEYLVDTRHI